LQDWQVGLGRDVVARVLRRVKYTPLPPVPFATAIKTTLGIRTRKILHENLLAKCAAAARAAAIVHAPFISLNDPS
jgi:hypothetical protein